MIKPDLTVTIPESLGNVHFVGMGGSGMSGIARLFLASGLTVSGSDRTDSKYLHALADAGATVSIGHDAANVGDADTIVVTSALWPDNPEYVYAQQNGLTILHRSQALAWLANRHRLIAVAGAHGKTTSTGMVVTALRELGADPSFVNGGVIQNYGTSSDLGSGELFVLEADESDGSFLIYDPAVAIITNIDTDHLDHYGSEEAIAEAFATFARGARELVVVSSDDAAASAVGDSLRSAGGVRVLTFGTAEHADVRVVFDDGAADPDSGPNTFDLRWYDKDFAVTLEVPGKHNAINAAGAFAALVGLGFEPELVAAAVARFGGTGRRFELHDVVGGVSVYDDYAHHPTEVAAALSAARTVVGEGRIVAVHQPHLYSRTQRMAGEFAEVLEAHADLTVVLDVCGAREDPVPGVTGALVSERFADSDKVSYQPEWSGAAAYLGEVTRPGDFVITLGCGDVNLLIPQILESLGKRSATQAIGA